GPKVAAAAVQGRGRLPWLAGGALLVVAAAAAAPFVLHGGSRGTGHGAGVSAVVQPWRGRLAVVARAAADRASGVEARLPGGQSFVALAEGAEVPPGAEVRTDARTRARIDLSDGTHVVLDRATTVRFDAAAPRAATLASGGLVADVAHLE